MEPEELIADLDKELRSVLGALQNFAPVTEEVTLSDETETVHVTVAPDLSLVAVNVAPAWVDRVEPEALAGVINEVLGRAQARAMGFDVDRLTSDGATPEVVVDEAEVERARAKMVREAEDALLTRPTEEELQRRIDALPGTVDAAMERLDREIARMQEMGEADLPRDPAEFTPDDDYGDRVWSSNHMVGVRVVGGLIADVTVKESWAANRSGNVLTQCFGQIIEQLPAVVAAQNEGDR